MNNASDETLKSLIDLDAPEDLHRKAVEIRKQRYGTDVLLRGLIEISNICKNNCRYCGIRASNTSVCRYRLTKPEILASCRHGAELGFQTFVLQGGEDPAFDDAFLVDLVRTIRREFPDTAITLSLGERSRDSYQALFDAGANRYLLRHETANDAHYAQLHPASMKLAARKQCLWNLKRIGYQVGSGFMVGSPGQTLETLVEDLRFLQQLDPDMIGIGPFIPAQNTPFQNEPPGSLKRTLNLIAILRAMFPHALIPATTALGSLHPQGRELGILAGANVVMPNLSPENARQNYALYAHKLHTGAENANHLNDLQERMKAIGYTLVYHRGDVQRAPKKAP